MLGSYGPMEVDMLNIGDKIPDFTIKNHLDQPYRIYDHLKELNVIYFYPKDLTPACTEQACAFRDAYDAFIENDILLIGISRDTVKSHQKFMKQHQLPFILLSDEGLHVADMFGIKIEKSMFGKHYFTNTRTTFVCNKQGIITQVYAKASPKENASEILKSI